MPISSTCQNYFKILLSKFNKNICFTQAATINLKIETGLDGKNK